VRKRSTSRLSRHEGFPISADRSNISASRLRFSPPASGVSLLPTRPSGGWTPSPGQALTPTSYKRWARNIWLRKSRGPKDLI
jgi:hypothetical protein